MPSPPAPSAAAARWRLRRGALSLERPVVVGILNVTPDSFSDGGLYRAREDALARARRMAAEGADVLDVGGESTRPGAPEVPADEELARVAPVVEALRSELELPISVDTRRAAVARDLLALGADAVNDVSALADPAMAAAVAAAGAGLVLMHMRGTPATMQSLTDYGDVAADVARELEPPLARALAAGVDPERVVLDPGIGFAKTAAQNVALIAGLGALARLGRPVLLGPSRKSFLGTLLGGIPAAERDAGTAGACVAGLARGARLFRVHDVRTARHALDVADAVFREGAAP